MNCFTRCTQFLHTNHSIHWQELSFFLVKKRAYDGSGLLFAQDKTVQSLRGLIILQIRFPNEENKFCSRTLCVLQILKHPRLLKLFCRCIKRNVNKVKKEIDSLNFRHLSLVGDAYFPFVNGRCHC